MSLLREAGHPNAYFYPIGYLHDEHALVVERQNAIMLTEAELLRQSVVSILVKGGRKALTDFRNRLSYEVVPRLPTPEEDAPMTDEEEAAWLRETSIL